MKKIDELKVEFMDLRVLEREKKIFPTFTLNFGARLKNGVYV